MNDKEVGSLAIHIKNHLKNKLPITNSFDLLVWVKEAIEDWQLRDDNNE